MGTFNDTIEAAISVDNWCAPGSRRFEDRPSDPNGLYDSCTHGSAFLQYLNITNPDKCRDLWLQSLRELADTMPESLPRERLYAQANQSADLPDDLSERLPGEVGNLVHLSARFLSGSDTVEAFVAFRCFARAYGQAHGMGVLDAETELAGTWKSRCTLDEWANGLS